MIFRVDGMVDSGTGHVMRCKTLADALQLRGVSSVFISRRLSGSLKDLMTRSNHTAAYLENDGPPAPSRAGIYGRWLGTTEAHDAIATIKTISVFDRSRIMCVVVDHYGLQEEWEKAVHEYCQLPIVAIDDLDRHHQVDILLDATFGKTSANYEGRVPESCKLLVGPEFALLRPEFFRERLRALVARGEAFQLKGDIRTLLVAMGGGDSDDVLGFLLPGLLAVAERRDFVVHALVGQVYPHFERLSALSHTHEDFLFIHRNVSNVAKLLATMDICIGAAGSSTWERCCLGLPSINVVIAENQRTIGDALSSEEVVISGGTLERSNDGMLSIDGKNSEDWATSFLVPLLDDPQRLRELSKRAAAVTDGFGTMRAVGALFKCLPPDVCVRLVDAEQSDAELIFQWQCFPGVRLHSRNRCPPQWEVHLAWLGKRLWDERCLTRMIKFGTVSAGLVRLDPCRVGALSRAGKGREISILIAPEMQGRGLATQAIQILLASINDDFVVAHVLEKNYASRRLFQKCGFIETSPDIFSYERPS